MGGANWDQKLMDDVQKANAEKAGGAAMGGQQVPMQGNMGQLGMGGAAQPQQVGGVGGATMLQGMPAQMGTGQTGQVGQGQGGAIQNLVTDYQQAKNSGTPLQTTTEQAVQQTLMGSGINPQQILGQGQQQGQQDPMGQMMNQLDGMMQQFNNYTGNPYQQKF
jgi:hypothetical protein